MPSAQQGFRMYPGGSGDAACQGGQQVFPAAAGVEALPVTASKPVTGDGRA